MVYGGLSLIYSYYLEASNGSSYYPDFVTNVITNQAAQLLNLVGYDTVISESVNELSLRIAVRGQYLARVVEGCNGVSVIILFISFIVAFAGRLKTTLLYVFAGTVLIYLANLVRIVVLCIGFLYYPSQRELLHSIVFPGIIYGMVFLLWMIWVNRFSKINK